VIGGTDFTTQTSASNVATLVLTTTDWSQRKTKELQLGPILAASQHASADVPEAFTTVFSFPPILGLSSTGGFQFMLEDRSGGEIEQLSQVGDALVAAARKRPEIGLVINTFRSSVPSYSIDMDLDKLQTLGVPVTDAYNTLQTFLGGLYVNDFNRFSHTWQVLIQAAPEFRNQPSDIDRFYVRSSAGNMVPLGTLASVKPSSGPEVVFRYNRYRAIQILGAPAPGVSSGQAIDAMEKVAAETLPIGYGYEWTGTTYQQKLAQGHEGVIFGFATVLVFLCLAALYESWSIPLAVLLSLPLGLFGALLAVYLRNYPYDVYTQIGIVTLIGLAAKNAILIVEFAKDSHDKDLMTARDAALNAAKLRLRPILMTSFAFILGVVPLFVATGAGAASRRSLGTTVFGGMLAATLLAIFFVPVQYFVVETFVERRRDKGVKRGQLDVKRPKPEPVEATD
jgi:hydrophobe/amphiphile efflux-1 (HAE1) family protein